MFCSTFHNFFLPNRLSFARNWRLFPAFWDLYPQLRERENYLPLYLSPNCLSTLGSQSILFNCFFYLLRKVSPSDLSHFRRSQRPDRERAFLAFSTAWDKEVERGAKNSTQYIVQSVGLPTPPLLLNWRPLKAEKHSSRMYTHRKVFSSSSSLLLPQEWHLSLCPKNVYNHLLEKRPLEKEKRFSNSSEKRFFGYWKTGKKCLRFHTLPEKAIIFLLIIYRPSLEQ